MGCDMAMLNDKYGGICAEHYSVLRHVVICMEEPRKTTNNFCRNTCYLTDIRNVYLPNASHMC
jgi:hypothetical protein